MTEMEKILNDDEKILWQGAPVFWPYIFSSSAPVFVIGIILFAMMTPFLFLALFTMISESFIAGMFVFLTIFLTPHFWLGLLFVVAIPAYHFLAYKHTHYVVTDKRVLFQAGLIGRDFRVIDFDQVTNSEVSVGIFDNLCNMNTGSIYIATNGGGSRRAASRLLRSVHNPYEVFKFIKKVSFDVKTDVLYPNKLRPSENPGYKTEYKTPESPDIQ